MNEIIIIIIIIIIIVVSRACSAGGCGLKLSTSTQGSMLQVIGIFSVLSLSLIITCDFRELPFPFPQATSDRATTVQMFVCQTEVASPSSVC